MLNKAATETLFPDISINLLKLPSSQGIVGEKSLLLPADAIFRYCPGYSRYADGTVCRNALHYYNHIARKCRGWSIRCTLINPVHGADVLQ